MHPSIAPSRPGPLDDSLAPASGDNSPAPASGFSPSQDPVDVLARIQHILGAPNGAGPAGCGPLGVDDREVLTALAEQVARLADEQHAAEQLRQELETVRKRERDLVTAQQVGRMGSWRYEIASAEWSWSPGLYELFGIDARTVAPSTDAWMATFPALQQEPALALLERSVAKGVGYKLRREVVRPDGTILRCSVSTKVEAEDGVPIAVHGTVLDVTSLAEYEATLDAERRFLHAVLDNLTEGVAACDAEGRLTVFNTAASELYDAQEDATDVPAAEWAKRYGLYDSDAVTPLEMDRIPLVRALSGEKVRGAEIVVAPPGRTPRLFSCNGQSIHDADGGLLGAVVAMTDVTAVRRREEILRRLALRDALTGLWNRTVLTERLEQALASDGWDRTGVLFLDLDGFKPVNDDLGHAAGDELLTTMAARLEGAVKDRDVVARHGGDEFVVLCTDVTASDLVSITDRIRTVMNMPVRLGEHLVATPASIGSAHAGVESCRDATRLLTIADGRMYDAKRQRR